MTLTELAPAPVVVPPTPVPDEIVVTVTLEDIRTGVQFESDNCAIVHAYRRQTGRPAGMSAEGFLELRDSGAIYSCPDAGEWALRFDKDRSSVAPERFRFVRVDNNHAGQRGSSAGSESVSGNH